MKRVLYRKIIHGSEESFSHIKYDQFSMPLHSHEEIELILVTGGTGRQFVNDSVKEYKKDDLTLIGSNTRHLHLCDSMLHPEVNEKSSCEIIQFPMTIFPANLSVLHEYKYIRLLLENSRYGIRFHNKVLINKAKDYIRDIGNANGIDRIVLILKLLDLMGKSKSYELISSSVVNVEVVSNKQNEPLKRIHLFLNQNFKRQIALSEIADYAGLTPSALCRYFKRHTGKSVFTYLLEIRVVYACNLLTNSGLNISQIAYESGFNNLSHFNKQFREITGQSPNEYRKNIGI